MKILALYLPQFHETPSNNEWWGKGYTEWDAVRNAKATSRFQRLPRIPLNNRYYDLSEEDAKTWKWQAELAEKYHVYGFVIYHYWFAGRKELYKPTEILLMHPEIKIHYSLCWDCSSWRRTWYANENEQEVLIEQNYGDELMWKQHFADLLPFFKDERYMKHGNKPIFHICYSPMIPNLAEMRKVWDNLAKENGFDGIYLVVQNDNQLITCEDAMYNNEPQEFMKNVKGWHAIYLNFIAGLHKHTKKYNKYIHNVANAKRVLKFIENQDVVPGVFAGTFCGYDDSPRRQKNGAIYTEISPEDFQHNIEVLLRKSKEAGNEYLYINAWNEWGECMYLEPDTKMEYKYLEAIKEAYEKIERECP